jgi:alkanesulfonate monooxygenase SsuD/methylene tetrahydromethanopterin reductase-like flavin-dependent oxidoreductase (luciferase family)
MEFNQCLTSYMPDTSVGGKIHFDNLVEQAVLVDVLGYKRISLPEHHMINLLLMPSPLQMAVKIATLTERVEIVTAVAVLPIRDMRIFAGELTQADILCDGRLVLGVGRGAFAYEIERLGVPMESTRDRLNESLEVLQALLGGEEVSWGGEYYQFEPLTIMPRPMRPIPMMLAVMDVEGIYHCAKRGFHIQTTVLSATHELLMERVNSFHRGKAECGDAGKDLTLSLQRMAYCARDTADAREKIEMAYGYYQRFDNMFTGPGIVSHGAIEPQPRDQSVEELGQNLLICPVDEMIDRLGMYADAGIDEVILSNGMGQSQSDMLDGMERFATEVMPHFTTSSTQAVT